MKAFTQLRKWLIRPESWVYSSRKNALTFILAITGVFSNSSGAEPKEFDCLIEANQLIEVKSPVPGLLESVPYARGAFVKKGAVVAILDSSVEKAASDLAKFKSAMEGNVESWKAKSELLGKKYDRRRSLAENKAISIQDRDDADVEKRTADAELKLAKENKELARLEWVQALTQLNRRTLRSPFNGIIVDQYVYPGEAVEVSETKHPILKLAQIDPLRVEIILPVSFYGSVKVGDSAEIMPEQPIGGSYTTQVKLVDKIVDSASGTFGVLLELPNAKLTIPAGIKCTVKFKAIKK